MFSKKGKQQGVIVNISIFREVHQVYVLMDYIGQALPALKEARELRRGAPVMGIDLDAVEAALGQPLASLVGVEALDQVAQLRARRYGWAILKG